LPEASAEQIKHALIVAIATAVAIEAAVNATNATREDIEAIWCRK